MKPKIFVVYIEYNYNKIHTYNNGIKCYKNSIFGAALKRYEDYINLHEPFEDTVFEHINMGNIIIRV